MVQTLAISETITTLAQAESKFNLRSASQQFFTEWHEGLPELTDAEKARLDLTRQRYLYHRKYGHLTEGAINFVVLSPLLEMAGFYDPPFLLRSEVPVKVEVETQNEVYRGRIDALVILEQLWVLLVESKQMTFSIDIALPQALTYMMSSPNPQKPVFGLMSNGGYFMFLKLVTGKEPQYALSSDFSLYRPQNELFEVLSVLKRLGERCRS
jgi:hypothetical protein